MLALKGCKLYSNGGRSSIGTRSRTVAVFNPEGCAEAAALAWWYADEGAGATFFSISVDGGGLGGVSRESFDKRETVASVAEKNLGFGEKPDYVNVKATVMAVKHDRDVWYAACPEEGNNKKLIQKPDGSWFCESNNKSYDAPEYRWILPLCVSDETSDTWITMFNDQAKTLLAGTTADTAVATKDTDSAGFDRIFESARFKDYIMRFRVKAETYGEETRVRVTCMRMTPVSYASEAKNLCKAIDSLLEASA